MSAVRTSSRNHRRSSSSHYRRHGEEEGTSPERGSRRWSDSSHRRRSSSHHLHGSTSSFSPVRRHVSALREPQRYHTEHEPLEGDAPLRRLSTQRPASRRSPNTHRDAEAKEDGMFHRRPVESAINPGRSSTRRYRDSVDHAPFGDSKPSTTLIGARRNEDPRAFMRHSGHSSTPNSSSRQQHRYRNSPPARDEDTERRSLSHRHHTSVSPHRSHRVTASPIRPERPSTSNRPRHSSVELHGRDSTSSARRHHHHHHLVDSATPMEAAHRQETLRYRSPGQEEMSIRLEVATAPSREHNHAETDERTDRNTSSARHHSRTRRSSSAQPESKHDSAYRRHRHSTPVQASSGEVSRFTRHVHHTRPSLVEQHAVPSSSTDSHNTPLMAAVASNSIQPSGSTYMRLMSNRRNSRIGHRGSYIEVISVNSARPDAINGFAYPRQGIARPSRHPHYMGPQEPVFSARGLHIMERIDSTRNWIQSMKDEVQRCSMQEKQERGKHENEARELDNRRTPHREGRLDAIGREDPSRSSTTSSRRSAPAAVAPLARPDPPIAPHRLTREERSERTAPATALVSSTKRRRRTGDLEVAAKPEKRTRSRHRRSTATPRRTSSAQEETDDSRLVMVQPLPSPIAVRLSTPDPAPAAMLDTLSSSRQEGFDYPIFSFESFLDGNTFHSTAGLCEYNTNLAEDLSDDHLEKLREIVFGYDEEAFAELLYGDDVQAEMDQIAAMLGHNENPAVRHEIAALQRAAVQRFNEKCIKARKAILSAEGGLAEAVRVAASSRERQAYGRGDSTTAAL